MTTEFFERAKPWILTAIAIAGIFGLLDAAPGFYGPFEFAEDHHDFAPWFAGTATTLGVWVALFNGARQVDVALAKEIADQQRSQRAESRAERAMAEAACGVVNMAHLNAKGIQKVLSEESWRESIEPLYEVMADTGDVAARVLGRFPIHQIPRPAALRYWYRVEFTHSFMMSGLSVLKNELSSSSLGVKESHLEARRDSILKDCERLLKYTDGFAKALGFEQGGWEDNLI